MLQDTKMHISTDFTLNQERAFSPENIKFFLGLRQGLYFIQQPCILKKENARLYVTQLFVLKKIIGLIT